ncbi:FAD-binding oxidoreductase [Rhizobiaceae bacterium CRRU44]|uniref:FAD-binding oxidoreductase n=1 Tax=Ferranicluibacter rubi TaxID=2715133 RepID=A0AA43ZJE8_9HYPH|nr:FAD-binding oxidoreductase [Ferranicluibacter rubi]NHT78749.1 FAD-binding oxidoreductase [Ferranicluibacter rubi]
MTERVIKRLPAVSGTSGWEAISRRRFPLRTLDGPVAADWLIIGAGFAGLSAARRLLEQRPADRIVLLEAGEVAKGTSGRNSGYMIDVPHNLSSGEYSVGSDAATKSEIAQNRFAISFAAHAAADYGMSRRTFDPSGKINAAASERGTEMNAAYARSLGAIGEKHQLLDAREMREITGSSYYHGGLYTPGAVLIQPADYIRILAEGLAGRVDIFEQSPVVRLGRDRGSWTATSHKGHVTAPKVIVAVNGHIEDFGHFQGRLMHIFTYASMTAPFQAKSGRPSWALLPADPMGATVRQIETDEGSRIVIRTRFTYDRTIQVTERRMARIAAEQRKSLDARFPDLSGVPFDYNWAGRLCLSRNHVAAFGEIEEGLYSACCENGLGTVKSTLAGVMAADLATGTHSKVLEDYMDQPKPVRLPPEPFAWLGVNAVIRMQELRAGREG